jgi:hypothetical protein
VLACLLFACSTPGPDTGAASGDEPAGPLPTRVAVLPFANDTSDPEAATVVRKVFYNYLSSLNYHDVELYTVDEVLAKRDLLSAVQGDTAEMPLQEICQYLGVDGLITGRVTAFGKLYALVYTDTQVGLNASLYHCQSGDVLWQREENAHDRRGGVPLSLTGIATTVISTYISHVRSKSVQVAAKLCLDLVDSMPNPETPAPPPPAISLMVHSGAGRLLVPGDTLRAVLVGDPGASGAWDISEAIRDLPLDERQRGIYAGEYVVQPGDREFRSELVGRLVSRDGAESRWIDVLAPVTLATPTPLPPLIAEDTHLTEAQGPYLASQLTVIAPEATLTVEPGTSIWFQELGLVVKGALDVEGEPERPVRFSAAGDRPWKGIFFDRTLDESRLVHAEIRGAQFGVNARNARVRIDHGLIEGNEWGVVAEDAALTLNDTVIRASSKAGLSARGSIVEARRCVLSENDAGGAQFTDTQVMLQDNGLYGNGKWDLKNRDTDEPLAVPGNWWGTTDPAAVRVQGPVEIDPIRESPPGTPDR